MWLREFGFAGRWEGCNRREGIVEGGNIEGFDWGLVGSLRIRRDDREEV
jgi:hypothetical protein